MLSLREKLSVIQTNDESTLCKYSLLKLNYIDDPFLQMAFSSLYSKTNSQFTTKPPIINRGYYARYTAIHELITNFIQVIVPLHEKFHPSPQQPKNGKFQIINLGSGYDTLYFQLIQKHPELLQDKKCKIIEVDFPEVIHNKIAWIQKDFASSDYFSFSKKETSEQPFEIIQCNLEKVKRLALQSDCYSCLGIDFQTFAQDEMAQQWITQQIDPSIPTLILSEMVLIYMEAEQSHYLLQWFSNFFSNKTSYMVVIYESIEPKDPFGKTMVKNLQERGCALKSISQYPTLLSQKQRLEKLGYPIVSVSNMNQVYSQRIDQKNRKRIEKLEMFDEFEEWHMLMNHYMISFGIRFVFEPSELKMETEPLWNQFVEQWDCSFANSFSELL